MFQHQTDDIFDTIQGIRMFVHLTMAASPLESGSADPSTIVLSLIEQNFGFTICNVGILTQHLNLGERVMM